MNINYINRTLSGANINPYSLKVLYNFDHREGPFVTNEVYTGIIQYETSPNLLIYKEYLPGIFLSCYGAENQTIYNSGLFSGNTLLKVSDTIPDDHFSLFLNYSNSQKCNYNYNPTGKNEILSYISSDSSSTYPFEVIIGINNANRIFLEFSGSTGLNHKEIYRKTIIQEPADQNIISLTINRDLLDINYHNFIEEEINSRSFKLDNNYFNQNKNIYFGQKPTGKSDIKNTGFYGVIDDILIFNEYISPNIGQVISKDFIKTGELVTGIIVNSITYNTINSGYVNITGIIGTGITGYQNVLYQQINLDCGDNCTFYIKSGITGFLTGEKIEYKIVEQETVESSTGEYIIDYYDLNYGVKFSKNKIIFNQPIDQKDIFEINYYNQFNNIKNLNYSPAFSIYSANENLSGNKFLLFLNGVNIDYSGYLFLSGRNNQFQLQDQIKDNNDLVKYYRTDEALAFVEKLYTGGYNSPSNPFFTFHYLTPYNFYLNGIKLISGNTVNISAISSSRRVYFSSNSPTGIFYAIRDYNTKFQIGSGLQKVDAQNYVSKNIWLNGILQEKNDKYILSSCVNNSLYGDKSLALPQDDLFDEEYFRFASGQNDTDLDYDVLPYLTKANITGDTQKNQINSFVKELKRTNIWDKFQNILILKSGYNSNDSSFYDLKNTNFSGSVLGGMMRSLSGYKIKTNGSFPFTDNLYFPNYPIKFTGNFTTVFLLENYTGLPIQGEAFLSNETYQQSGFRMGYPFSKEFNVWTNESVPAGGIYIFETNSHPTKYSFITASILTGILGNINSGTAKLLVDNKTKIESSGAYKINNRGIQYLHSPAGGNYGFSNNIALFALSNEDLSNYHSLIRDIAKNTIYSNLDF